MDLANDRKLKLAELGVKELQYVLSMLGLEYHGSERDLRARILDTLVSEQVPSSTSASIRACTRVARNEFLGGAIDYLHKHMMAEMLEVQLEEAQQTRQKISCLCGFSSPDNNSTEMIEFCNFPLVPEFVPVVLTLCKSRFWIGRIDYSNNLTMGSLGVRQDVNFSSKLEMVAEVMYLINHKGYEVQACCIFLDDVDQFRMRWPSNSKIKVNGNDVKTEGRLGPGGLRDGVLISTYLDEGSNDISFTASPNGIFRLGIRLVKPRTIQEVCSIICNKQDGELLNDATARVIRCVTGGAATLDAAQRELEVLADSAAVDLRCPISGGRMKIASRFRSCIHMACFDLESFLGLAKTTKKIEQSGADTAEIKIRADGSWFPSNEASTSRTNSITCDDLSSPQRTPTNHGASLDDPLILSDSD
ncbi:hypothetical protein ACET3Z_030214 [Daucus carota]